MPLMRFHQLTITCVVSVTLWAVTPASAGLYLHVNSTPGNLRVTESNSSSINFDSLFSVSVIGSGSTTMIGTTVPVVFNTTRAGMADLAIVVGHTLAFKAYGPEFVHVHAIYDFISSPWRKTR